MVWLDCLVCLTLSPRLIEILNLFLDLLGSAAFSVVQSDLKGNIAVSLASDCTI